MKIEYVVSYPELVEKGKKHEWVRKTKKFTDILERNAFMKEKELDIPDNFSVNVGRRIYVKQIILHDDQGD